MMRRSPGLYHRCLPGGGAGGAAPLRYAFFISFFPQLVVGPIERSKNLLEQMWCIEELRLWDGRRTASGAVLMAWGFFMKMVIADRAAILVDQVFGDYRMYGSTELILGDLIKFRVNDRL